ncbi:NFACT family protein, partial [Candidatus Woesearchaeota archaeon]|nr:NFACT family protein [Candidatus Woesearchaeota archaeon]
MKTSLTGLELKYMLKELDFIVGGKVNKVFHPAKKDIIFHIHVPNKGKTLLRIVAGKIMFVTSTRPEAEEPDSFALYLRKILFNARIKAISQLGTERIVKLEFDDYSLYIELFGRGNFVVCDNEDKILNVEEKQVWKDRSLVKDEIYRHPKKEYNYNTINAERLALLLDESGEGLVRVLATELGLGGQYAEEVCLVSGVDKDKKKLTVVELENVIKALQDVVNRQHEPVLVMDNGKIKDVLPFKLQIYEGFEQGRVESLSSVLDEIYARELESEAKEKGLEKYNEKLKKMENVIEQQ